MLVMNHILVIGGTGTVGGGVEDSGAVLYLASEESAWVTGIILDVAGGAVMVS